MEKENLHAEPRQVGSKAVRSLRAQGFVPAVLYGREINPQTLQIERKSFAKVYQKVGESTLLLLEVDNQKPVNVLIHDIQRHPVTDEILHADFLQVKMTEKIRTSIVLEVVGLAPAVEELEGNLITPRTEIEVECLPDALVPKIQVDTSALKTFEDVIHVKDLPVPEGIEVLTDPEELVAQVTPPRSEEELEAELAKPTGEKAEKEAVEKLEEEAEKAQKEGAQVAAGEPPAADKPAEEKKE